MGEFAALHPWSFAVFSGFLVFISLASLFNHRKMSQVKDKTVAIMCIIVSALSGLVVTVFVKILVNLVHS